MPESSSNYQVNPLKLFIILITFLLLVSCVSPRPPALDKSGSFVNRPKTHIVIPGDTLFSIAWRYGLKYEALAKHNGISSPYVIRPSQIIRLNVPGFAGSAAGRQQGGKSIGAAKQPLPGTNRTPASIQKEGTIRQENRTGMAHAKTDKKQVWGAPQWRWPASGPLLSSFQGTNALNKGIDLGGKLGEPVLAAAGGQVVYSGSGLRGYGKLLIVKHNESFLSAYAYNDRLLVKEGDFVKAGQRIADMGSSGTDRVKLHFEIRRDGTPVDPLKFLPRR